VMKDQAKIKAAIKTVQSYEGVMALCKAVDVTSLNSTVARKLLRAVRKHAIDQTNATPVRIAYLGNITFEPLPDYVEIIAACRSMATCAFIGDYVQYVQALIDERSTLTAFAPEIIFLHLTLRELAPAVVNRFSSLSSENVAAAKEMILDKVISTVNLALSNSQANVIVSNFPSPSHFHLGIADQKQACSESDFYAELNQALKEKLKNEARAQVLDMEQLISAFGKKNAYDEKLYYLAKVPWQEDFYVPLADQLIRHVAAASGQSKKCLVLDLDNTLWGGVLGESGIHGVKVGHGDGESEAFYDFQCRIRALKDRGILLAVCSKNNLSDVEEMFSQRNDMSLQLDDFSALEVSWDMKHEGLRRIAEKLNIGLDSLVFIDDNPAECELITQMLPQVETLLLPADPSVYPALIDNFYGFDKVQLTDEDKQKSRQYAEGDYRTKHQASFDNLENYLESLQTEICIKPVGEQEQMRAHQLFTKTNQFNVTTKRYSMAEVETMVVAENRDLYCVQAKDRFGDLGIIGLCLVDTIDQESALIDSFILSCRAMGRGIEKAVMNFLKQEYFERRGMSTLNAEFSPTKKNIPAQQVYPEQGFEVLSGKAGEGCQYTLLANNSSILSCHWIKIN